jgi:subtilisin family serine protease
MKRTAFLACVAMVATLMAAGVVSAQTEDGIERDRRIGEVPLEGDETRVGFVPGEVVVETQDGEYEIREVDARSLGAMREAAEEIEAQNPAVEETSPNYRYRPQFVPNDWYFDPKPEDGLTQAQYWLRAIRAPGAWNDSRGGDVKIGVVDTGWQLDHPDLVSKVAGQRDFVGVPPDDEAEGYNYHGTSVAGVAAAQTNDGEGVASVGFHARFVMAKACTDDRRTPEIAADCKTSDVAPAIEWLVQEQNVKIINLSFGGEYPNDISPDPILGDAIREAQEAGALVVAGVGNGGEDEKGDRIDTDPATTDTPAFYPACFDGVLGVGAVNEDGTKAGFSNFGPCADLVAPGVSVLTTYDENDPYTLPGDPTEYRPLYTYVRGTSFAAPQVAGAAALVKAARGDFDASQIAARLQNNATDLGEPGRDEEYGHGLLNARCSVTPSKKGC